MEMRIFRVEHNCRVNIMEKMLQRIDNLFPKKSTKKSNYLLEATGDKVPDDFI